jgi:hypothetical protein
MRNNITELVKHVKKAAAAAEKERSKLTPAILQLEGMSGNKGRHFLNNLVYDGCNYLEIGTWKGSTMCSALYENKVKSAITVDNFSQFDGALEILKATVRTHLKPLNHTHINADSFSFVPKEFDIADIDVYFYDGAHGTKDQYDAVAHYIDCLSKVFILVVDDWNGKEAKDGTRGAIKDLNLKTHLYISLPDESILGAAPHADRANYWNGFGVFVLEKP